MREIPAPSGTAMAMRAETFRELGGFAEELFMYLEDLDWGWLLRNGGTVWRRRRHTQALRRQRDRDLARYLTATFSPAMTPVPALLRVANPFVRGYWRLVRLAL